MEKERMTKGERWFCIVGFTVCVLIIAAIVFWLGFSVWVFDGIPNAYHDFSEPSVEQWKDDHDVLIPPEAVFVRGYESGNFRDPLTHIVFQLPIAPGATVQETVEPMLGEGWSKGYVIKKFEDYPGYEMTWGYRYPYDQSTELMCSDPIDGIIICYLILG